MREDPWLTGILGYPVYNSTVTPESDERSLTCAKVPVEDIATVNELTGLGFRVVDVNVKLVREPGPTRHPARWIEPARLEHHEEILDIAGSCFDRSRFHLDPLISNEDANRIKREWLRSFTNGSRGIELLVALDGDAAVGFLAVDEQDGARTIDLIGVAGTHQRRAVGAALVLKFIWRHRPHTLRVGTQVGNFPSLRMYERAGFRFESASYALHLHRGVR